MGNPIFRFTLRHEVLGDLEISEPLGWIDAKLTLERHEDYNSLIEYFNGSFTFYGTNGVIDGGLNRIRLVEQTYGPDATLEMIIEASFDSGYNYIAIFSGQLDLTTIKENMLNQAEVAIIRDDFWAKFIARKSTPVDLNATVDLDHNPISQTPHVALNLTSQIIDKVSSYNGSVPALSEDSYVIDLPDGDWIDASGATEIMAPSYSQVAQDVDQREIDDTFTLPMVLTNDFSSIFNIIELISESGFMVIDINVPIWDVVLKGQLTMISVEIDPSKIDSIAILAQLYLQVNADAPILIDTQSFSNTGPANPPTTGIDRFFSDIYELPLSGSYSNTFAVGDVIRIFIKYTVTFNIDVGADTNSIRWVARSIYLGSINSTIKFSFKSVYQQTRANSFLIHDAAAAILKSYGLGVDNPLYSNFFGSQFTNARTYDFNGCGWKNTLTKGLQLRGYSLDEKIFSQSFEQWWAGANPIFNLGLTYETVDDGIPTPGFTPFTLVPLNMWGEDVTGGWLWTGGTNPFNTAHGPDLGPSQGNLLEATGVSFEAGQTYKYAFQFTYSGMVFPVSCEIHVIIANLAVTTLIETVLTPPTTGGTVSGTFEFVCPVGAARIGVRVKYPGAIGALDDPVVTIDSFTDLTVSIPPSAGGIQNAIRIEERSHFYDTGSTSMDFDNVIEIDREYDPDYLFNKVEIGYTQWQSENISGIDDPQTKHTYASRFQKIGKGTTMYSDFIAASLAHEVTRRQTITKSKDYKFDNETFITAINPDDTSPDSYIPELDENFNSITGLLNPETRYNSRLTPARNLIRWFNVIQIGLQNYIGSLFKFVSGEGNYGMASDKIDDGCRGDFDGTLNEGQDIPVTDDYLHLPLLYNISLPMPYESYATIAANRKKAIGISQSDSGHVKFYIKKLDWSICKSQAIIQAWPAEYLQISQTDFVPPDRNCSGLACGDDARLTSDGDFRVTSDGDCRITI